MIILFFKDNYKLTSDLNIISEPVLNKKIFNIKEQKIYGSIIIKF